MAAGGLGIGQGPLYAVQPFLDAGALELLLKMSKWKALAFMPCIREVDI